MGRGCGAPASRRQAFPHTVLSLRLLRYAVTLVLDLKSRCPKDDQIQRYDPRAVLMSGPWTPTQ
jgi:hypothetical protein